MTLVKLSQLVYVNGRFCIDYTVEGNQDTQASGKKENRTVAALSVSVRNSETVSFESPQVKFKNTI